jgi:hypothetical protein
LPEKLVKEKFTDMTKSQWRLIPLLETDGKTQMNIDRWLLHKNSEGKLVLWYIIANFKFY